MSDLPAPVPLARFDWERMLRAADLHRLVKLVGFVLSQYADSDGSRAMPGTERLAEDCSVGVATVKRSLKVLRDGGFVILSRKGNVNSAQRADVYQLSYCTIRSGGVDVVGVSNPWQGRGITPDPPSPADEGSPPIPRPPDGGSPLIPRPEGRGINQEGTGDQLEGGRGITADPQPDHYQPLPKTSPVADATTDSSLPPTRPKTTHSSIVEYQPANPIYAAARGALIRRTAP